MPREQLPVMSGSYRRCLNLCRQEAYMHYLFGVTEEGFWGAVDTRDVGLHNLLRQHGFLILTQRTLSKETCMRCVRAFASLQCTCV